MFHCLLRPLQFDSWWRLSHLSSPLFSFTVSSIPLKTSRTMTLMILISAETLKTLQNVLKKHRDTDWIQKERKKRMFNRDNYQFMKIKLNKKHFLQSLDSDNIKVNIYYIRQKFIRYTCMIWILMIWPDWADKRKILWPSMFKKLTYSCSAAELQQKKNDVVFLLNLWDLSGKEVEKDKEEINQLILIRF